MRLVLDDVAQHLHRARLLRGGDVVRRRVRVHDVSRRNLSFKVVLGDGGGLFVKQAGSADLQAMVATEAAWLRLVAKARELRGLRWFCPRWVRFDPESTTLVTGLVHPATSLTKFHLNAGRVRFPPESAGTTGRVLGLLHEAHRLAPRRSLLKRFPPQVPHALQPAINFGMGIRDPARGGAQLIARIRAEPGFLALLERAAAEWRAEALVHGDARWDNFLVTSGRPRRGDLNLRLIDWESLGAGEPAWDVAFHLAEYVRMWAAPIRPRGQGGGDEFLVPFPRERFRDSAGAFWEAYVAQRGLDAAGAAALWERASRRFVPAALMQVALELTQRTDEVPRRSEVVWDLARRAASEPEAFCAETFGVGGSAS